jgi:phosphatidylglycerol---prolipoprotein diacylglyceryl transferase
LQFPVVFEIGESKILLHSILEVIAYFVAFRYFLFLRRKKGDSIVQTNRMWIIIGAIFGSLIGSRLIGGLEDPTQIARAENVFLYFYSNKTVLGGFLGGLFGVELVKKMIAEKQASGDLFTYPLLLGLIIGRIGCFSMGVYEETYGTATSLFTGMDLGDGIKRHPVTLYEISYLFMLWVFIYSISKRTALAQGASFKLFMIGYCVFRFFCDFIKPHYNLVLGLSVIQLTALAGLLWYARYIFYPKNLLPHTVLNNQ